MNISPITFGKQIPVLKCKNNQAVSFNARIPLYNCQVKDMISGKNVPAVVSEFDCKDYSDLQEMAALGYDWMFAICITSDMRDKYDNIDNSKNFYILHEEKENEYGEVNILGICETENINNDVNIAFIESKYNKKYKYVGQTLIAAVGKRLLKNKKRNLFVKNPAINAISYYIDKCGFKEIKDGMYRPFRMKAKKIKKFIKRTEEKTGAKLIDIKS